MEIEPIYKLAFANALVWLIPLLFLKGLNRYYVLLLAIIFSGSYWAYVPVHYGFELRLPGNIIEIRIGDVLKYSLVAGASFYTGIFLFLKNKAGSSRRFSIQKINNPLTRIPNLPVVIFFLRAFVIISVLYSLAIAITQIGIANRIQFMDSISPFWYSTLLPINAILICILIVYEFKRPVIKISGRAILLFGLILIHVLLVGFDGSRRYALPPILVLGVATFFSWTGGSMKKSLMVKLFTYILTMLLFSSVLSLGRSFNVGWQIFAMDIPVMQYVPEITSMVVAPMSTLHVNTQMAEFISVEGPQGYRYYFNAIGNTLLPRFLFRQYLFGDPLVTVLHERFGWYGQDFGFMAEAIYSGGMPAVVALHFIFGLVVASILNGISKGRLIGLALAVGLLFGCLNSLRSDFMNLLKVSLYLGLFLYLVLLVTHKFRFNRTPPCTKAALREP